MVYGCRHLVVLVLVVQGIGISYAQTEELLPMTFLDSTSCVAEELPKQTAAPYLFQNIDGLQLRTTADRHIPKLTAAEYNKYNPGHGKGSTRTSIPGMDINDQGKVEAGVFLDYTNNPNYILEGRISRDGKINDTTVKKMRPAISEIARRSKESIGGDLVISSVGNDNMVLTEYQYDLYQIVYLYTEGGLEERMVEVSIHPCNEKMHFVSRIGTRTIQHEKDSIPFRIFLSLDKKTKLLTLSYGNKEFEDVSIP